MKAARAGASEALAEGIWCVTSEVLAANTYVCVTGPGGECIVVDPGSDGERIDALLVRERLVPRHILLTHGHFDHCGSAAPLQEKYGCDVRVHHADRKLLNASNFLMMAFKIPFTLRVPTVEVWRENALEVSDGVVDILPSPGHTPGSCILRYGDAVFTGDTLYSYGIGLSRLPGENAGQLRSTIQALLETIPPDAMIYPGHGPAAPFARVRRENLPLLEFLGAVAHPSRGA